MEQGEDPPVVYLHDIKRQYTQGEATLTILNGDANDDGLDLLAGQGANLSQTNKTHITPGVAMKDGTTTTTNRIAVNDLLDLVVANAGNAKSGVVVLYVK